MVHDVIWCPLVGFAHRPPSAPAWTENGRWCLSPCVRYGLPVVQRQNMWRFMSEKLGIEEPEKVWRPLFQKYNQSAKGLRCLFFAVSACCLPPPSFFRQAFLLKDRCGFEGLRPF